MQFELPQPTELLLFADGIIYTQEEIIEVFDFILSEDSPFAIKNALPQLCSIIHFARAQEKTFEVLNQITMLICNQNLRRHESEQNITIKIYLLYHLLNFKELPFNAAQVGLTKLIELLSYVNNKEISLYKVHMIKIMNRYQVQQTCMSIIQQVLDGTVETQTWGLMIRLLIKTFFDEDYQFQNAVLIVNALLQSTNHLSVGLDIQSKLIRFFMTVKEIPALRNFKAYLVGLQLMQPEHFILDYEMYRPLLDHQFSILRNMIINIIEAAFQTIKDIRVDKNIQNLIDKFFEELQTLNLNKREKQKLIDNHYRLILGKLDLKKVDKINPYNKNAFMKYVHKHPVSCFSKNIIPKSQYEFENQHKEAVHKYFLFSVDKHYSKLSKLSHNNNRIEKTLWSMRKKLRYINRVDDVEMDESTRNKLENIPRQEIDRRQNCPISGPDNDNRVDWFEILELQLDFILDLQYYMLEDLIEKTLDQQYQVRQHAVSTIMTLLKNYKFEIEQYKIIADAIILRLQDPTQKIRAFSLRIFDLLIQSYFKELCSPFKLKYFLSNLQIRGLVKYQQEISQNRIKNLDQFEFKIDTMIPQEFVEEFRDNINLKGLFSEARMIIKLIIKEGMEDEVIHHYQELVDFYQQIRPYILQNLHKFECKELHRPAIRTICFTFSKRLIGSEQLFRESFNYVDHTQKDFMEYFSQQVYEVLVEQTFNATETVEEIFQLVKFMTDVELDGFTKVWHYYLNRPEKFILPNNFYKLVHAQLQYGSGNQLEALKVLQIYFEKFPILLNEHRLLEIKKLIQFEQFQVYQNTLFLKQIITVLTRFFDKLALQIVFECQDEIFKLIAMNIGSFDIEWFNIIDSFFEMICENSLEWECRIQCCLYWMINICKNLIQNDKQNDNRLISQLNEKGFTQYLGLDQRKVNLNARPDTLKWIYEGLDVCDYLEIPDIPGPNQAPLYLKKACEQDNNDLLLTIASSKVLYQKYKKYSHLMPNALQTAEVLLSQKSFEMTVETYLTAQSQVIAGLGKFVELYGNKLDLIKYDAYLTVNQEDLEDDLIDTFRSSELYEELEYDYYFFKKGKDIENHSRKTNKVIKRFQDRNQFFFDKGIQINRFFRKGAKYHRRKIKGDFKAYQRYVKKLRRQFCNPKQIKEICYKKREQKIDQYAVYKIYKKENQENMITYKLQTEGQVDYIMNLFSALNDVNYILNQYYDDDIIIDQFEGPERQERKKQLARNNPQKIARKFRIKMIMSELQKVTKGDKIINRRIKQFIKGMVFNYTKHQIFQILRENEDKIRDGSLLNDEYKKEKTYYNTPPLEILIKDRLKRIYYLKQEYQALKQKEPKNQKQQADDQIKLQKLKYRMEIEKIKGEIEEANFDPEINIILKEIQEQLKDLLMRWCTLKEDKDFEMTRDFLFMIMRNFISLPENTNGFQIENPQQYTKFDRNFIKKSLYQKYEERGKNNDKKFKQFMDAFDKQQGVKYKDKHLEMEVEVEAPKIQKKKKKNQDKNKNERKQIYQLSSIQSEDENQQEVEDQIEENQQDQSNQEDKEHENLQQSQLFRLEESSDEQIEKFQGKFPIQFVPYEIEGIELQSLLEEKQQLYNQLANLYLSDNKLENINPAKLYTDMEGEWYVDPRLSLKEQQRLLDLQKELKIQLELDAELIDDQEKELKQVELAEFMVSSEYDQETKNEDLLAMHDEIKSDLLINPYVFLYLNEYCIKVLSCFKKETLELKPSTPCRINWEYVDGIHETLDRYRVPLPQTKYWATRINEFDIFSQYHEKDEENEDTEKNQANQMELEKIEEENASEGMEIEEDQDQYHFDHESDSDSSDLESCSDQQSNISNSQKYQERTQGNQINEVNQDNQDNQDNLENEDEQNEEAQLKKLSRKSRKIYKLVSEYFKLREKDKFRMNFFEILEDYEKDEYKNAKKNQLDILDDLMELDDSDEDQEDESDQESQNGEIKQKDKDKDLDQDKDKKIKDEDEDADEDKDEDEDDIDIDNEYLEISEEDDRDPQEQLGQLQKKIQEAFEQNSDTESINPIQKDNITLKQEKRSEELYKASVVIMFLQDYFDKYDVGEDDEIEEEVDAAGANKQFDFYAMEVEEDEQNDTNQDQEEKIDPELEYTFTKIIDQYARLKKTKIAKKLRQIKQQEKIQSLQIAMKTKQNILDQQQKVEQLYQAEFTDLNELLQTNLEFLFPDQEFDGETQFSEFEPINVEQLQLDDSHDLLSNEIIEKVNEINELCKGKIIKVSNQKKFITNRCSDADQQPNLEQFAYQYQQQSIDEFYKILLDTVMRNDTKKSIFINFCSFKFNQINYQYSSIQEMILEFTKKQMYSFEKFTMEELDRQEQKVEEEIANNFFQTEEKDCFGEEQTQWLDKARPMLSEKIKSLKLIPSIKQFVRPRGAYQISCQWQPSRIYYIALNTFMKIVLHSTEIQEVNLELLNSINTNPYTPTAMKINIMYFLFDLIISNTTRLPQYLLIMSYNIHVGDEELQQVTVKLLIYLLKEGYLSIKDYIRIVLDALEMECDSIKLVIHSFLSQLSDSDPGYYFSVAFDVLDDKSPNCFNNIHNYMTYLKEFTFDILLEALIQCIGMESGSHLQFNAVYAAAIICNPKITQILNESWESIETKFKEERTIIALAQMVYKFRHFCKKETYVQAVANFEQVYNLIRQKSDKVQSKPFEDCPEWFELIFNKQEIELDQQFDQEYQENDDEEKLPSEEDDIEVEKEQDLEQDLEQVEAPVEKENKVNSLKAAIIQLIHRFFFTKNKKIKLELNEEILIQINQLQIKDPQFYFKNMEEVLKRIKNKIREKEMKKKTYNDRQIKENYKYYLQCLFEFQPKQQFEDDEEEEEYQQSEDQQPINMKTINSKFEQGKQLMETILNANSDIQKWVQMQIGAQKQIDEKKKEQKQELKSKAPQIQQARKK